MGPPAFISQTDRTQAWGSVFGVTAPGRRTRSTEQGEDSGIGQAGLDKRLCCRRKRSRRGGAQSCRSVVRRDTDTTAPNFSRGSVGGHGRSGFRAHSVEDEVAPPSKRRLDGSSGTAQASRLLLLIRLRPMLPKPSAGAGDRGAEKHEDFAVTYRELAPPGGPVDSPVPDGKPQLRYELPRRRGTLLAVGGGRYAEGSRFLRRKCWAGFDLGSSLGQHVPTGWTAIGSDPSVLCFWLFVSVRARSSCSGGSAARDASSEPPARWMLCASQQDLEPGGLRPAAATQGNGGAAQKVLLIVVDW